jgi:hypothetical protein
MYVPTTPATQTTPRVRELAQRITDVVRSYRQSHPDLSLAEIRQSAQLAMAAIRAEVRGGAFDVSRLVPAILGVLLLLLGLGIFMGRQPENSEQYISAAVAVVVTVIGLVVVFVARHRSLK